MITVAAPNPVIGFLEQIGFFTFLSYLLIFIVLYYFLREILERYVKRPDITSKIRLLSISFIFTVGLYFWTAPYGSTGTGMSYVAAAVFVLVFVFIVVAVAAKILGLDLIGLLRREK